MVMPKVINLKTLGPSSDILYLHCQQKLTKHAKHNIIMWYTFLRKNIWNLGSIFIHQVETHSLKIWKMMFVYFHPGLRMCLTLFGKVIYIKQRCSLFKQRELLKISFESANIFTSGHFCLHDSLLWSALQMKLYTMGWQIPSHLETFFSIILDFPSSLWMNRYIAHIGLNPIDIITMFSL